MPSSEDSYKTHPLVFSEDELLPDSMIYSVQLPTFEGPLDLLLHLIQKHELDILDVPMAFITKKYLEYLDIMRHMKLDLAAEYLVMAATLLHIKSKMLLPEVPEAQAETSEEDELDPREELIKRLLEYQKYKQAASELETRGIAGMDVFPRGSDIEEAISTGEPPLAPVSVFALIEAFAEILAQNKVHLTHDIVADRLTINDRIHELVDALKKQKRVVFSELFDGLTTRFDLVITLLALLEMSKLRLTKLYQTDPKTPIYIELSGGIEEANLNDLAISSDGSHLATNEEIQSSAQSTSPALTETNESNFDSFQETPNSPAEEAPSSHPEVQEDEP